MKVHLKKKVQLNKQGRGERYFFLSFVFLLVSCRSLFAVETMVASGTLGSVATESAFVVVREAYRKIGVELTAKWLPGNAALESSNGGLVDAEVVRLDGITRKYPNLIQIPIPVNFGQVAVFSKDASFLVTGYESLKPYRIAIVKGVVFARQGTEGMDVQLADSYADALQMVANNQVDVAVLLKVGGLAAIAKENLADVKMLEGTPEILLFYHYVHKRHKDMVPELEKVLKQMLLDGTTRRLLEEVNAKYFPGEGQQ